PSPVRPAALQPSGRVRWSNPRIVVSTRPRHWKRLPQMELQPEGTEIAVPTTWYLAQINAKVIDGWQSLGIASSRPAAAKIAASGYAAAARRGIGRGARDLLCPGA